MEIADVDRMIARGGPYMPRWGWHDDHRAVDRTDAYLPALMQVRSEYEQLLALINALPERRAALQLGMGPCVACHDVWRAMFGHAATIDLGGMWIDGSPALRGASTHDDHARSFAALNAPYDLLFIDAGHDERDCAEDHADYGPLVRPGGLIVFHDALPRAEFPEVGVWRHLEKIPGVAMIGTEVGTAWVRA